MLFRSALSLRSACFDFRHNSPARAAVGRRSSKQWVRARDENKQLAEMELLRLLPGQATMFASLLEAPTQEEDHGGVSCQTLWFVSCTSILLTSSFFTRRRGAQTTSIDAHSVQQALAVRYSCGQRLGGSLLCG